VCNPPILARIIETQSNVPAKPRIERVRENRSGLSSPICIVVMDCNFTPYFRQHVVIPNGQSDLKAHFRKLRIELRGKSLMIR
jgi:hypothetical protein